MSEGWRFEDFYYRLRIWIDDENPSAERQFACIAWMYEFQDNLHYMATPAAELDNIAWFARIPGGEDGRSAVVCLYVADPVARLVKCSTFTTLRKPI